MENGPQEKPTSKSKNNYDWYEDLLMQDKKNIRVIEKPLTPEDYLKSARELRALTKKSFLLQNKTAIRNAIRMLRKAASQIKSLQKETK